MPTYNFKNTKTGEEWSEFMSISEMEKTIENPEIELMISIPSIVSGVDVASNKQSHGFCEVLRNIQKKNPTAKINTFR